MGQQTSANSFVSFDPDTDDWPSYHDKLEMYFNSKGIRDGLERKTFLLDVIGTKLRNKLRDLLDPTDLADDTVSYSVICVVLNSYFEWLKENDKERPQETPTMANANSDEMESEAAAENKRKQERKQKNMAIAVGVSAGVGILTAGIAFAAAPLIAGAALAGIGFGAGGVVAGSMAAGIQALIGNVAAGSLFAILQSAGAAGIAAGTATGIGAATGVVAAGATAGVTVALQNKNDKSGGEPSLDETSHGSAPQLTQEEKTPTIEEERENEQGDGDRATTDPGEENTNE